MQVNGAIPELDEAFAHGGVRAVVRELLAVGNPDDATFKLRWSEIYAELQKHHPDHPKSGFVE